MTDREQFKSAPAVDVSPNWPPVPSVADAIRAAGLGLEPAPVPAPEFYETPGRDTITECAVCLFEATHDDAIAARRPLRSVTAIDGTPCCMRHLVVLDEVSRLPGPGEFDRYGVVEAAARNWAAQ